MIQRVEELAHEMRKATRARVLPRSLNGIPCEVLPLDNDLTFVNL